MKCEKCFIKLSETAKFCEACGYPVLKEGSKQQYRDNLTHQNESPYPANQANWNEPQYSGNQTNESEPPASEYWINGSKPPYLENQANCSEASYQERQVSRNEVPYLENQSNWNGQQYSNPYNQPSPNRHYGPGSYAELAHKYGGSVLFLVGISLFSAGSILLGLISGLSGLFELLLAILPITGLWLVFAASKAPRLPEKMLPALTCFKVYAIIYFVLACIAVAFIIFSGVTFFITASTTPSWMRPTNFYVTGVILIMIAGVILTFSIMYLKATLGVIGSIRQSLIANVIRPVKNIRMFTVLTFIYVGIAAMGALIMIFMPELYNQLFSSYVHFELDYITRAFTPNLEVIVMQGLFNCILYAGIVVYVVALNQFNGRILAMSNNYPHTNNSIYNRESSYQV